MTDSLRSAQEADRIDLNLPRVPEMGSLVAVTTGVIADHLSSRGREARRSVPVCRGAPALRTPHPCPQIPQYVLRAESPPGRRSRRSTAGRARYTECPYRAPGSAAKAIAAHPPGR